jgi:hypothetical protein
MKSPGVDGGEDGCVPALGDAPVPAHPNTPAAALVGVLNADTSRPVVRLPRWLGPAAVAALILYVPWMIYLAYTLPRREDSDHYDVAWLGFDIAQWAVMGALAYAIIKRRPAVAPLASAAATLLVVDAWFDMVTASTRNEFMVAFVLAALIEVPAALVCVWITVHAEKLRTRAYVRMRMRWQWASIIARRVLEGEDAGLSRQPDPQGPR